MNVTILGAGAYALGLAFRFNKNNNKIIMWSKVESEIEVLSKTKSNPKALPNVIMPSKIIYTTNTEKALEGSDIVVLAVATKFLSSVCDEIKPYVKDKHIVIASKGIERDSCKFATDIVKEKLKTKKLCTISGPSFATDMVNDSIVGLSLATTNSNTRKIVTEALLSDTLKLRPTKDFLGVELCGTLKNVIAVTAGILDGMNVSDSTRAMFLTESINDTRKLIKKMGGNEKTIMSFAGFGDILLTCTSKTSRNYTYGRLVGEKRSKKELTDYLNNTTVEGVYTLEAVYELIRRKNIKLPFLDLIHSIVFEHQKIEALLPFLMNKD